MYCTSCDRGNHVRLGGISHRQLLYLLLLFPLEQQEAMTNNYLHLQKPKIQFQAAMTVMYQLIQHQHKLAHFQNGYDIREGHQ